MLFKLISLVFNMVPMPVWNYISIPLSYFLFFYLKRERKIALAQINFALKNKNPSEILIQAYQNVILSIIETFRLDKILNSTPQTLNVKPKIRDKMGQVQSTGVEEFQNIVDSGTGAFCIASHLSNFELMAAFFSYQGLPMTVMARSPNSPKAKIILSRLRSTYGIEIIWREDNKSITNLLRAIKNNKTVCALIDQDTALTNVFSNFFGLEAAYPMAPVQLAIKFNRPILFASILREKSNTFTLVLKRINWENQADPLKYILDEYSKNLEYLIQENPGLWVWWHRRWRRRPNIDYAKNPEKLRSTKEYIEWINKQNHIIDTL